MVIQQMITAIFVISFMLTAAAGMGPVPGDIGMDQHAAVLPDSGASAGEKPFPLMVGEPPPPLTVGEWLRGDPVEKFEAGRIYVVDFWATWCAECTQAIPHIAALQDQYMDQVTIVGVNILEYLPVRIPQYLEKMEGVITYSLVRDDVPEHAQAIEGSMAKAWLGASGHEDIPLAFIIDRDTRIAWIGYSLDMIDPLAEIVAGTWDRDAFAGEYLQRMRSAAAAAPVKDELEIAFENKNWKAAMAACRKLLDIDANEFTSEAAVGLNRIAAMIVASPSASGEDLDVALDAARQANELTGYRRVFTVSTMADVHFKRGNIERAIELLKKAIELGDAREKRHLEKTLDRYRAALDRPD